MARSPRPSSRSSPQDAEPFRFEFSEEIELAGCELRWDQGDRFALIEAVAICAARQWDYPGWVRRRFDQAYTSIFLSVFPGVDLSKRLPGSLAYSDPQSSDEAAVERRFDRAVAGATKLLYLSIDRQKVLQKRKQTIRDLHFAMLVAELARYKHTPRPMFVNAGQIITRLAKALDLRPNQWATMNAENAVLLLQDGIPVRILDVPPEYRLASVDQIKRAWRRHESELLARRAEQYEADHE
jgi:hypothetical protein